jgi:myb proto-oncogene protein
MWGNDFEVDWDAIAALVPGRTTSQCKNRWKNGLDPIIDRTTRRTGTWTEDEDTKLKDSVERHSGQNWGEIAELVPGRTRAQCHYRWHSTLDPSIDRTPPGRWAKWTEEEDSKLKDAVKTHGGKDWGAIAALVPGRTRNQCRSRWRDVLDPNIDQANGRTGKWTEDEDSKLKDAVKRYGGKNWKEIAALVPGRTKVQCHSRWQNTLNLSIDRANGRTGKWGEDEDSKLKDSVQMHGSKDWAEIAALVPGRVESQCRSRWQSLRRNPEQR